MTVDQTHVLILNAVTTYDRKQSTKKYYNHYALALYCAAVGKVFRHVENGAELRTALLNCFVGQLANVVLKSVKLDKMTEDEKLGVFPRLAE
jgi:hypothetical protein